ncbi:sensor histidine kinase [Halomonas sp. XH26]|uniref:ATP-binding protein n=1 Tax=Halomonas sp. XH26 TaxID=2557993 RepID=UPI00209FB6BE|nr:ATP-binding protein [Halomonas sp. XH26]UTA80636.1 sensor histidine kinase [Halomonas sp. XH26]
MSNSVSFKAKAHLLKLLGDELIGDDRLAIFELVKNAYDADATRVDVTLDVESSSPKIIVRDFNGCGMSRATIIEKWMEIGTDSKRKNNRKRSPKYYRMPLGEKGIGRLAVHKLGTELTINTRADGYPECKIHIDWPSLINESNYIEETKVDIQELKKPEVFQDGETGTRIEINSLNNETWTRGDVRRLKRLLTSLVSPFSEVSDFAVNLSVPGREKDIEDVLDAEDILSRAIWRYDFFIDESSNFSYSYAFNPPSLFKELSSDLVSIENERLELIPPDKSEKASRVGEVKENLLLAKPDMEGIGPISGTFYFYLRDRKILNAQGAYQDVKKYLDEQTGVRVYRDGIRVFNYGEVGDDWLDLNTTRINTPGKKIANNMVIASLDMDLEKSFGLKEKTNREGFDENSAYKRFRWIILSALDKFYQLHFDHRESVRKYIDGETKTAKQDPDVRFTENIESIRGSLKKHGLEKEIGGKINQIESDYKQMRDVTLSSGIAGINLAVIFHEVERGVDELNAAIKRNDSHELLLGRSDHLSKLLEGFTPLLRRNEQKTFSIKALAKRVLDLSEHRFQHHKITASCPLLIDESPDFKVKGPFGLLQAALTNLVDNAIHWTTLKAEKDGGGYTPAIRLLTLTDWFKEGPALVVADNGPGFEISPDQAVLPFKSTRSAGMGLGLYYADKVMETIGGRLIVTTCEELDLPKAYSGAAIVMLFKGEER